MNKYQEAINYFSKNQYHRARDLFYLIIKDYQSEDYELVEDSYNKIIFIADVENNKQEKINLLCSSGDFYKNKKNYIKAAHNYQRAFELDKSLNCIRSKKMLLEDIIFTNNKLGNIHLSCVFSKLYLSHCLDRKLIEDGLKFIDDNYTEKTVDLEVLLFKVKFLILKGHVEEYHFAMVDFLNEYSICFDPGNHIKYQQILKELIGFMTEMGVDSYQPSTYNIILLRRYLENVVIEKKILGYNRSIGSDIHLAIIKTFIESLVLNPSADIFSYMITYFDLIEDHAMKKYMEDYCKDNKIECQKLTFNLYESRHSKLDSLNNKTGRDSQNKLKRLSLLDFQREQNLFGRDRKKRGEIKRLEKRLLYLTKMKRWGDVDETYKKLKNIDGDNILVLRVDRERSFKNYLAKSGGSDSREVFDQLLGDLEEYDVCVNADDEKMFRGWEFELLKKMDSQHVDQKNYKDYCVMFCTLGFYRPALAIIERMKRQYASNSNEKLVEVLHLEILIYLMQGGYSEGLEIVKYVKEVFELSIEELLCFSYVEGDLLLKQNRIAEARGAYQIAYNIDPKYRFVRDRLLLVENLK